MASLEELLKFNYDMSVSFIKNMNFDSERKYFSKKENMIPFIESPFSLAFEEYYAIFKERVRNSSEEVDENIFNLLKNLLFFEDDKYFKMKLKADLFTAEPIDELIFPMLEKKVKEKYNDKSISEQNLNRDKNLLDIYKLIYTYTEFSALLYFLYCNNFQFVLGFEGVCPDAINEVLIILKESNMTRGNFLHALINNKAFIMEDIFKSIENLDLRKTFLERITLLRDEKHKEVDEQENVNSEIINSFKSSSSNKINVKI